MNREGERVCGTRRALSHFCTLSLTHMLTRRAEGDRHRRYGIVEVSALVCPNGLSNDHTGSIQSAQLLCTQNSLLSSFLRRFVTLGTKIRNVSLTNRSNGLRGSIPNGGSACIRDSASSSPIVSAIQNSTMGRSSERRRRMGDTLGRRERGTNRTL